MGSDRVVPIGGGRDTGRLETFCDGVIAIAITLLVLEVRVPHVEEGGSSPLWTELRHLWPQYLGYLTSFAIIGIMWANHHNIFRHIARTDHYFVLINLLFLLFVAFIPFPTALLTEYLTHPGERVGGIVYSGWILLTALSYYLLWWYPSHDGRLLKPDADPRDVQSVTRRFRLGPPSYGVAFLLSFVSTIASLVVLIGLALLYLLPNPAKD